MKKNTFRGGVHPYEGKELAKDTPLTPYLPKGDLVFFMNQHIGKPAKPLVAKGDKVLAGQMIGEADGFVSANIFSSVSGTVKSIETRKNVMGAPSMAIVIENDGQYTKAEGIGEEVDFMTLTNKQILDKIKWAGIVGMGGAGFPTAVKLMPKNPDAIQYVIANGAECEPYITCDDQLMRTKADEIVTGIDVMLRLFPQAEGVIVIEENKPEAIAAMQKAVENKPRIRVFVAQTKYPQGGERSLISLIADKHLKLGMLPADAGCVVDNVGTVQAIYHAVCKTEPLTERGFTVSGDSVVSPQNFIVKIGTSQSELVEACGGFKPEALPKKVLSGGPMMGLPMVTTDLPVCKNNNALTALSEDEVEIAADQMTACLRCGRCNRACPLALSPQLMSAAAQRKNYDRYEKKLYGLECIGCGCCTYACPAKRPLMQLFKQTKAEIMATKKR